MKRTRTLAPTIVAIVMVATVLLLTSGKSVAAPTLDSPLSTPTPVSGDVVYVSASRFVPGAVDTGGYFLGLPNTEKIFARYLWQFVSSPECVTPYGSSGGYAVDITATLESIYYVSGGSSVESMEMGEWNACIGRCNPYASLCYTEHDCEPETSAAVSIFRHGYSNVWFGGYTIQNNGDYRRVKWCSINGFALECREIGGDRIMPTWVNEWPTGHSPGEWTASEDSDSIVPGTHTVIVHHENQYAYIALAGETAVHPHACSGSKAGVFLLSDNGVPVSAQGKVASIAGTGINTGWIVNSKNMYIASQSPIFTCAGPVVDQNGNGILPPACGVRNEKGELAFGTFSQSGSLKYFSNEADMLSLKNYRKNNRAMVFSVGNYQARGKDVVLLVDATAVTSPLTVTVPGLHVSGNVSSVRASVAIVTSTGKRAIVALPTVIGQNINIVIPPEIVSEVSTVGGEITVRAVAAGDTGEDTSSALLWYNLVRSPNGHHREEHWLFWTSKFPGEATNQRINVPVNNAWFVPTSNFVSSGVGRGEWLGRACGFVTGFRQDAYYRYIGDVAQASVRLIPIQASIEVPDNALKVSVYPDAPQKTGVFVSNGTPIPIPADVPLRGAVRLDMSGVRVAITYTSPISGVVSFQVRPRRVEVSGGLLMPPCGLGWRNAGCDINSSWESVPVGVTVQDMQWPGAVDCVRYNVAACYSPQRQQDGISTSIGGWIKIKATARVTLVLPNGVETVDIDVESPQRQYLWPLPILQETR